MRQSDQEKQPSQKRYPQQPVAYSVSPFELGVLSINDSQDSTVERTETTPLLTSSPRADGNNTSKSKPRSRNSLPSYLSQHEPLKESVPQLDSQSQISNPLQSPFTKESVPQPDRANAQRKLQVDSLKPAPFATGEEVEFNPDKNSVLRSIPRRSGFRCMADRVYFSFSIVLTAICGVAAPLLPLVLDLIVRADEEHNNHDGGSVWLSKELRIALMLCGGVLLYRLLRNFKDFFLGRSNANYHERVVADLILEVDELSQTEEGRREFERRWPLIRDRLRQAREMQTDATVRLLELTLESLTSIGVLSYLTRGFRSKLILETLLPLGILTGADWSSVAVTRCITRRTGQLIGAAEEGLDRATMELAPHLGRLRRGRADDTGVSNVPSPSSDPGTFAYQRFLSRLFTSTRHQLKEMLPTRAVPLVRTTISSGLMTFVFYELLDALYEGGTAGITATQFLPAAASLLVYWMSLGHKDELLETHRQASRIFRREREELVVRVQQLRSENAKRSNSNTELLKDGAQIERILIQGWEANVAVSAARDAADDKGEADASQPTRMLPNDELHCRLTLELPKDKDESSTAITSFSQADIAVFALVWQQLSRQLPEFAQHLRDIQIDTPEQLREYCYRFAIKENVKRNAGQGVKDFSETFFNSFKKNRVLINYEDYKNYMRCYTEKGSIFFCGKNSALWSARRRVNRVLSFRERCLMDTHLLCRYLQDERERLGDLGIPDLDIVILEKEKPSNQIPSRLVPAKGTFYLQLEGGQQEGERLSSCPLQQQIHYTLPPGLKKQTLQIDRGNITVVSGGDDSLRRHFMAVVQGERRLVQHYPQAVSFAVGGITLKNISRSDLNRRLQIVKATHDIQLMSDSLFVNVTHWDREWIRREKHASKSPEDQKEALLGDEREAIRIDSCYHAIIQLLGLGEPCASAGDVERFTKPQKQRVVLAQMLYSFQKAVDRLEREATGQLEGLSGLEQQRQYPNFFLLDGAEVDIRDIRAVLDFIADRYANPALRFRGEQLVVQSQPSCPRERLPGVILLCNEHVNRENLRGDGPANAFTWVVLPDKSETVPVPFAGYRRIMAEDELVLEEEALSEQEPPYQPHPGPS